MLSLQNRPRIIWISAIAIAAIALIALAIIYVPGGSSSYSSPYGSQQVALQPTSQASSAGGQPQTTVTLQMVDVGFSLPEFTVPANTDATITLQNTGQLPHTFVVSDHNNSNVQNLDVEVDVNPGETGMTTVNAPAGDYYFYCRIPGHEASGMHGIMHVQ